MERSSESPSPAERQFGPIAAAYAASPIHASGPDLAALIDAAGLFGHERVLDIGCGADHTALAAAPRAAAVTAVDVTPEMLETAARLAAERGITNITFRRADASDLPFPDDSFDVVTSRYSAHHFADPARAVAEAARVLRPGGRLLLADTVAPDRPALDTFFNAAELLRDGSHVRNWRIAEWMGFMAAVGFEPALRSEWTIDLDGPSWVARSQTPPDMVAALRALFRAATPEASAAFAIREGGDWGWRIPAALIRGILP